jgi:hypothetical protein
VAEVGVDPLWRRLIGSLVCAAFILPWMFGIDRLPSDADDAASFAIFLGICWLIAWRAWPAVEITWEFFTSPEARHAYRPTWSHVLGAFGLGMGLILALAFLASLPLVMAGRNPDVEPGTLIRGMLQFTLVFYVFWPAIVVRWRRVRTPAP